MHALLLLCLFLLGCSSMSSAFGVRSGSLGVSIPADFRKAFTIEFWVNTPEMTGWPSFTNVQTGQMRPSFGVELRKADGAGGQITALFGNYSEYGAMKLGTTTIDSRYVDCVARSFPWYLTQPATWVHVVMSWDGAACKLTVDGKLRYQQNVRNLTMSTDVFDQLMISSSPDVLFSEVRIWAVARTTEQILQTKDIPLNASNVHNHSGLLAVLGLLNGTLADVTGRNPTATLPAGSIVNASLPSFPSSRQRNQSDGTYVISDQRYCVPYPDNGFCRTVLNMTSVWSLWPLVPINTDQVNLLAAVIRVALPPSCYNVLAEYMCQRMYPRCEFETVRAPVIYGSDGAPAASSPHSTYKLWLGLGTCKKDCEGLWKACNSSISVLKAFGEETFNKMADYLPVKCSNCSCPLRVVQADEGENNPVGFNFPVLEQTGFLSTSSLQLLNSTCHKDSGTSSLQIPDCPFPTVPRQAFGGISKVLQGKLDSAKATSCSPWKAISEFSQCELSRCPIPLLHPALFDKFRHFSTGVAMLCFVISGVTFVYEVRSKNGRAFPGNILTAYMFCMCLYSFGYLLSFLGGYEEFLCSTEPGSTVKSAPSSAFENGLCALQAIVIQSASLASTFYWAGICHNLHSSIAHMTPVEHRKHLAKYYLFLPLLVSGVTVVGLLATDNLGLSLDSNICRLRFTDVEQYSMLVWLGLQGPLLLGCLYTFGILCLIAYKNRQSIKRFRVVFIQVSCLTISSVVTCLFHAHVLVQLPVYIEKRDQFWSCNFFNRTVAALNRFHEFEDCVMNELRQTCTHASNEFLPGIQPWVMFGSVLTTFAPAVAIPVVRVWAKFRRRLKSMRKPSPKPSSSFRPSHPRSGASLRPKVPKPAHQLTKLKSKGSGVESKRVRSKQTLMRSSATNSAESQESRMSSVTGSNVWRTSSVMGSNVERTSSVMGSKGSSNSLSSFATVPEQS